MDYVKSQNILGVEARQLPCFPGKGAPTSKTEGAVGELYLDTDTGNVYKCIAVSGSTYTWEIFNGGGGGGGTSVTIDKTLSITGAAADAKVVGDQLGNIEAALDHIIQLQNALIGGDV